MTQDQSIFVSPDIAPGGVFALGNFDGVHRGHHVVIAAAIERARALGIPARVLTFEPHPRAFFAPGQPTFRLTLQREKERLLKECGIADVIVLPFTPALAQMTAADFVEQILRNRLGAQHIVAGYDFTFGYQRGGTMRQLAAWLAPVVGVTEIAPQGDGAAFSSTRIRDLLRQGDIVAASALLGHDWTISGVVIRGAQRGRTIGVPTANIDLGDYLRPLFGVYAVRAGRVGEALTHKGVANIGLRPTVGGASENLEAHLFDFDQDIYGQEWQFALTQFIRPEQKFENFDTLKQQIAADIHAAKAVL